MGCAQKWYAGKKGLATGVIGGAVGLSGAALTLLVRFLSGRWGIRACFWVLGGLLLAVCAAGSALLENPENAAAPAESGGRDFTPRQMLKTRQYKLVFLATALASPAVLLFSPVIVQLGQERGLSEGAAHLAVAVGSVGSAAGRLAMPAASDRIGRRAADLILFGGLCGLSAAFAFAGGWWVVAVYTALTFCYSGEAAVLPSLCTDLFGMKHTGVNYGFSGAGHERGQHRLSSGGAGAGPRGGPPLAGGGGRCGGLCLPRGAAPHEGRKAVRPAAAGAKTSFFGARSWNCHTKCPVNLLTFIRGRCYFYNG